MITRLSAGLRDRSRARLDGPLETLEARGPSPSTRDADVESAEDEVGTRPAPRVFEGHVRVVGFRSAKVLRREGVRRTAPSSTLRASDGLAERLSPHRELLRREWTKIGTELCFACYTLVMAMGLRVTRVLAAIRVLDGCLATTVLRTVPIWGDP